MDGFINIVKYKQSEYDIDDGFDLEQLSYEQSLLI